MSNYVPQFLNRLISTIQRPKTPDLEKLLENTGNLTQFK